MVGVQRPCIPFKTVGILSVVGWPARAGDPHEFIGVIACILEIALNVLFVSAFDLFACCSIARVELFIVVSNIGPCHVTSVLVLLIEILLQSTLPLLLNTFDDGLCVIGRLHCAQILGSFLVRELRQERVALLAA
jgi:hypothetical protein